MRHRTAVILAVVLVSAGSSSLAIEPPEPCRFVGGRWYNGESFETGNWYSVDGLLVAEPPGGVEVQCEVDLAGTWVIPALAEGHIHHLHDVSKIEEQVTSFHERGVFYALVQGAMFEIGPEIRSIVERPDTVDAIYMQGNLMPRAYNVLKDLYKPMLNEGLYPGRTTVAELDGREVTLVDSADELRRKWPNVLARNPHVVKVLLAFSDDRARRLALPPEDPTPRPGVDPDLLPEIVQASHAAGRRVSVHIETAEDFRLAVAAGADLIAHLPGWRIGQSAGYHDTSIERWLISPEDARQAADRGVAVITTTYPKAFLPDAEENRLRFAEIHRTNLETLRRAGVQLAIGSDHRRLLVPAELSHLEELGVIDRATLLRLAVRETPTLIFPNRRIGRLEEGYEATFLALAGDPLADFSHLGRIVHAYKQGYRIPTGPVE